MCLNVCVKSQIPYLLITSFLTLWMYHLQSSPAGNHCLSNRGALSSLIFWDGMFSLFCREPRYSLMTQTGRQSSWRQAVASPVAWLGLVEWLHRLVRRLRMDGGTEHLGVPRFLETDEVSSFVRLKFGPCEFDMEPCCMPGNEHLWGREAWNSASIADLALLNFPSLL